MSKFNLDLARGTYHQVARDQLDAIERGLSKFFGKPCPHGHTIRNTRDGYCVACRRIYDRERQYAPEKSRMLDIDHTLEEKACSEEAMIDEYYHMEL